MVTRHISDGTIFTVREITRYILRCISTNILSSGIYRAKTKYGNIVIKDLRRVTTQLLNHVNKCVMRTWPMLCVFFCEQFMALSNNEFSI